MPHDDDYLFEDARIEIQPAAAPGASEESSGTPLITGATGFVGSFLLREQLLRDSGNVQCLVRARDEASAARRIEKNLRAYGLWDDAMRERIHPIPGDLTKERLGLSEDRFHELAYRTSVVYHVAAIVNLALPYALLKPTNVEGTRELLRLAACGRPSHFHHLSSFAIFDSAANAGRTVSEVDAPIDPSGLSSGYCQSKWVAERMVHNAARAGLPTTIYRVGWVGGHSATGECNRKDFLFQLLMACIEVGVYTDLGRLTLTPVDFVIAALLELGGRPEARGATFHLSSGEDLPTKQIFEWMNECGLDLRSTSYDEFARALAGLPSARTLAMFLNDGKNQSEVLDWGFRGLRFDADQTRRSLANVAMPPVQISRSLVGVYVKQMLESGYVRSS